MSIIELLKNNSDDITLQVNPINFNRLSTNLSIIFGKYNTINLNNNTYNYVANVDNFIVTNKLNKDVNSVFDNTDGCISFRFCGCYMSRYIYQDYYYIDHIFIGENDLTIYNKWRYYANNFDDIILFRPKIELRNEIIEYHNVDDIFLWGVIDNKGNCYSVFVRCTDSDGNHFKLYAIYKHTGKTKFNRDELDHIHNELEQCSTTLEWWRYK